MSSVTVTLVIRKNTQKSMFLLSQAFKWKKIKFFVIPVMPLKLLLWFKKNFLITLSYRVKAQIEQKFLNSGICMRRQDNYDRDALHFAPFVLFPSPFPRHEFNEALHLQPVLNELMHKVIICWSGFQKEDV